MSYVSRVLSVIEQGDTAAANQLLPLGYAELRKLAKQKLARAMPNQTLDATAVPPPKWIGSGLRKSTASYQGFGGRRTEKNALLAIRRGGV